MSTKALRLVGWALLAAGAVDGLNPRGISPTAGWLATLTAWLAGIAWLRRDAVDRRVALLYDWFWLMAISWPVSLLWYGRRSRRGWSAAIGLASLPIAFPFGGLLTRVVAVTAR